MKSFIYKIQDDGSVDFLDKQDKAAYERLLSSIKRSGRNKFKVIIQLLDEGKSLSESQKNLFNVLIDKISDYSGNDFNTVRETLVKNILVNKDVDDLNHSEFNGFLEAIIVFCNDFFNLNVSFNSETNYVEINKMR